MKRVLGVVVFFYIFSLALPTGSVFGFVSPCTNSLIPPFVASGVKPNILIVLDNSQSFDEDFSGNAVGSYSALSKSVAARQALQTIISSLQTKANVGLMTYTLPGDVQSAYLHNSLPFASYDPNSYCGVTFCSNGTNFQDPPQACSQDSDCTNASYTQCLTNTALLDACQQYCTNPDDTTAKAACDAACPSNSSGSFTDYKYQNGSTDANGNSFPDAIIGDYAYGSATRARYCGLTYPKTNSMELFGADGTSTTVYWRQADPMYAGANVGTQFGYCGSDVGLTYNYADGATNYYNYYYEKTGTSDLGNGYTNYDATYYFTPTDSDYALGFYNFGQRKPWYYVGPTWFSESNVTSGEQGYLHVAAGDINPIDAGNDYSALYDILTPNEDSSSSASNYPTYVTPYMSCAPSGGNYNLCSYIVNAGNTPTAGVLQSALQYFNGNYIVPGQSSDQSSPISYPCQKSYVILVTDGLPDTTLSGTMDSSTAMDQVLAGLEELDGKTGAQTIAGVTPSLPNGYTWTTVSHVFTGNANGNGNAQTKYYFPVQTFVLGVGSEATSNLDLMAQAGGTAVNGHAYYAKDATQMASDLETIIQAILAKVAAGSSVSNLANSYQNGGNMMQAVFYQEKYFGNTSVTWPGYLYDWWDYTSPATLYCTNVNSAGIATSYTTQTCTEDSDCSTGQKCLPTTFNSIREDNDGLTTFSASHDYILDLEGDYDLDFQFDYQNGLSAELFQDANGKGDDLVDKGSLRLDALTPVWEAGKMLWETPADDRVIYTPGDNSNGSGLVSFDTTNTTLTSSGSSPLGAPANFDACLQGSSDAQTLGNLINYVRGDDISNNFCSNGTTFESPYVACDPDSNPCTSPTYNQCLPDNCRNRTVGLCAAGTSGPFSNTACSSAADCTQGSYTTCVKKTWKLGDIVYSTPKVAADYTYCASVDSSGNATFTDTPCTQDSDCVSGDSCLAKESVVFVGANDGMLHAFETGVVSSWGLDSSQSQVAKLVGISDSDMGKELWAFIPKNVLPYLRCLATGSCHLYYDDLTPYITTMYTDTSGNYCANVDTAGNVVSYTSKACEENTDCADGQACKSEMVKQAKKILIGGLRLGGGSITGGATSADYCVNSSGATNGVSCTSTSNCPTTGYCLNSQGQTNWQTCSGTGDCTAPYNASCSAYDANCSSVSAYPTDVPTDTCSGGVVACSDPATCYNPPNCIGLSSYYAIDITDVEHPKLLWEFSDPLLGYSYSGPAVIHKWSDPTTMSGDQYDVMFLSGPTDAADGSSVQNLRAFILELDPQTLKLDGVYQTNFKNNTGNSIANAFGGRLFTTGVDVDGDGYTDFVFFGYSSSPNGKTGSWAGGIAKVYTDATKTATVNGNTETVIDPVNGTNPADWTYDVSTYDNIPQVPITAQVATMKCFNTWYLFTGTGRYFFPLDNYGSNGNSGMNYIMGVPFTCNDLNLNCGKAGINNVNASTNACSALQTAVTNADLASAGWMYDLAPASDYYCATVNSDGTASAFSGVSCANNSDCPSGESCEPLYLSERVITDPTPAPGTNTVYFTSTQPTADPCGYGGQSAEWGFNCATGGPVYDQTCPGYIATPLTGNLYLQTSTGAIYNIGNPSSGSSSGSTLSFSSTNTGGRSTSYVTGMPPESAIPMSSTPGTGGKLIQWIEK